MTTLTGPAPAVRFLVGRDDHNHWVAVETRGLCGGIFADEAAALRFARAESGGRPGAVRSIARIEGDFPALSLLSSPRAV